jgi:hypothetical protein
MMDAQPSLAWGGVAYIIDECKEGVIIRFG